MLPHLDYADTVWGDQPGLKSEMEKLQSVQNKFKRKIKLGKMSSSEALRYLNYYYYYYFFFFLMIYLQYLNYNINTTYSTLLRNTMTTRGKERWKKKRLKKNRYLSLQLEFTR